MSSLEIFRLQVYYLAMDVETTKTPPGWIVESLERSEAQITAGKTVPLEPVLDRLRASIARMRLARSRTERKTARKA